MDFYHQNPTTLRRLLNKRQNPCTQIFKTQPLNSTNGPRYSVNLAENDVTVCQDDSNFNFTNQNSAFTTDFTDITMNQHNSQNIQNSSENNTEDSSPLAKDDEEEGDLCENFEKIQKKMKTSMISNPQQNYSRRPSCEEFKDEVEHSTSCETHSEHLQHEGSDFILSPQHSFHSAKEPTELKLDDEEILHTDVPSHSSQVQSGIHPKTPQEVLEKRPFESNVKSNCKINHQCDADSNGDCPRCQALLRECKEFANKNGGSCLNGQYEESIVYQCQQGHRWTLNHRNARRRWCAQCAKEERAFLKKKCEEEKVEREKQEGESQQKLFEEAKKKAMKDNVPQPNHFQGAHSSHQKPMSAFEYFQRVDFEVETLAKKYTIEFMSQKDFTGNVTYQQSLQVYKIVIMPDEILQSYMFNLNADTLRSEFRRMAKIIHPDKNKHPQAGNAFQKVYRVYEAVLSRLTGTQKKI